MTITMVYFIKEQKKTSLYTKLNELSKQIHPTQTKQFAVHSGGTRLAARRHKKQFLFRITLKFQINLNFLNFCKPNQTRGGHHLTCGRRRQPVSALFFYIFATSDEPAKEEINFISKLAHDRQQDFQD